MSEAPLPESDSIRKIAVLRALVLGDLLAAVPALRALRAAFASAEISLVGLPQMREFSERLSCIDRFIEFPGHPGLPEIACDVRRLPSFFAAMQAERFDLALQLHGSGPVVNPIVATFGARWNAGFFIDGAGFPARDAARFVRWPETGREAERLLALTDHLGLPRQGDAPAWPLVAADRDALAQAWPGAAALAAGPRYVCVHAGAQLASRRWPPERFAAVADRLAASGRTVVLTGTRAEAGLVESVAAAMRFPAVDLAGRTTLWSLAALIDGAELLVCNDTGVSHVADALGRASVVVSSGAEVARWAPLDGALHRVLWAPAPCRPCSHAVCPSGHECAEAIGVDAVIAAVEAQVGPLVPTAGHHRPLRLPTLSQGPS